MPARPSQLLQSRRADRLRCSRSRSPRKLRRLRGAARQRRYPRPLPRRCSRTVFCRRLATSVAGVRAPLSTSTQVRPDGPSMSTRNPVGGGPPGQGPSSASNTAERAAARAKVTPHRIQRCAHSDGRGPPVRSGPPTSRSGSKGSPVHSGGSARRRQPLALGSRGRTGGHQRRQKSGGRSDTGRPGRSASTVGRWTPFALRPSWRRPSPCGEPCWLCRCSITSTSSRANPL